MTPTIIWQGDRIQCMKSSRTAQCKICMTERIEILHRMRTNRNMIINDNSDIFAPCKCGSRFHKFSRTDTTTLRTRLTQNKVTKVPSTRHSKQKRSRFSFDNTKRNSPSSKSSTSLCSPCNSRASPPTSPETPITPEPASPPNEGFLIDVNLFDYQTPVPPVPIELLSNLQRDQLRSVFELEQRVYDV